MGNLVLFGHPPYGHITPATRLAEALVRRGERVRVYACEPTRAAIEAVGAEFRAYGEAYERFDPRPATKGLFHDMARLAALSGDLLPQLLREMDADPPDAVLMDSKALWARWLGAKLGIPCITHSVVFAIRPGLVAPRQLLGQMLGGAPPPLLREGLREFQRYRAIAAGLTARLGVECPDIIEFLGNPQALNVIFTTREFQLQGEAFDATYCFAGPLLASRHQGPEFDWSGIRRPLIYISLGTTFFDAPGFYAACYRAFADVPAQVVIACGPLAETLPPPPPNIRLFGTVPQVPLLAMTDVFITHGGMNSANEALALSVPQLVVPQRGDQYLVARRVTQLGAGLGWRPEEGWEVLRARTLELMQKSGYRARAAELAAASRAAGGAERAATVILEHLAGRRAGA